MMLLGCFTSPYAMPIFFCALARAVAYDAGMPATLMVLAMPLLRDMLFTLIARHAARLR